MPGADSLGIIWIRPCRASRSCRRWGSRSSPEAAFSMAYDTALAARVRRALAKADNVTEKSMFGGLTFMVAANMCCGLIKDELMIRLAPETTLEALDSPAVRVCDFTSRPMRGLFVVS